MSKRRVKVSVLCEDVMHEVFLRRLLLQLGFHPRNLEFQTSPFQRGSAEQFVRERFSIELNQHRRMKAKDQRVVVMIDADVKSLDQRMKQFDLTCRQQKIHIRSAQDHVCILIPKRHIETWIQALTGHTATETKSYKSEYTGTSPRDCCRPAADQMAVLIQEPQDTNLNSLSLGIAEIRSRLLDKI